MGGELADDELNPWLMPGVNKQPSLITMGNKLSAGRGVWGEKRFPLIHHVPLFKAARWDRVRYERVRYERGQELVEFALVLMLLLLIAFGALDLGRLFHAYITITNAAREGARYGATNPPVDQSAIDDIINVTKSEALDSGIVLNTDPSCTEECADIIPSCPEGSCGGGHPVRVGVAYDFNLLLAAFLADPTITLNASAQMVIN
jgi:hypothetical protein